MEDFNHDSMVDFPQIAGGVAVPHGPSVVDFPNFPQANPVSLDWQLLQSF